MGIGRVILRVLDHSQTNRQTHTHHTHTHTHHTHNTHTNTPHTHTKAHTHEYSRIPLGGWSFRRSDLCLHNTQKTRETPTHTFNGIRNRDPSYQVAADLQCVPHVQHISPTFI